MLVFVKFSMHSVQEKFNTLRMFSGFFFMSMSNDFIALPMAIIDCYPYNFS